MHGGLLSPHTGGRHPQKPLDTAEILGAQGLCESTEFDDLQNDIGERVNPAGENPDKIRDPLRDLGQRRETVGTAVSEETNPLYDAQAEPDGFDWL